MNVNYRIIHREPASNPVGTGLRHQLTYFNGYGTSKKFSLKTNGFAPVCFSFPNDPVGSWSVYGEGNPLTLVPVRPAALHLLSLLFAAKGEQAIRSKYGLPPHLIVSKNPADLVSITGLFSDSKFVKLRPLGKRKLGTWNCMAYQQQSLMAQGQLKRHSEFWFLENTRILLFSKFTQTYHITHGRFAGQNRPNGSATIAEKLELNPRLTKADFALPPGTRFIAPPIFKEIKNHIHPIAFEETEYDKFLFYAPS